MADEGAKFAVQADNLFAFLKQTFSTMPRWVQVVGWLSFLYLFVFLVLYPLIGVSYFQGKVIKIDQKDGQRITPNVPALKVHHDNTVVTNEQGEFTIAVRGPIVPMTSINFDFGENDYVEHFSLPAPLPFLSLFNPNSMNIYYTSNSSTHRHYFLQEEEADKAYSEKLHASAGRVAEVQDAKLRDYPPAPSVVEAASAPSAPGFVMRIRQLTLNKAEATSAYFAVSVNGQPVQIDNVPDAKSPYGRLLSIPAGKAIRIENFDIPLGQGSAQVKIDLFGKRMFFLDSTVSSGSVSVAAPKLADIGQSRTTPLGNLEVEYEILPPVGPSCTGIVTKAKNLLLVFWIETPAEFLDSITGVQYDLGPSLSPRIVTFPTVTKSNNWAYEIVAYSPQVIRADITVRSKDLMTGSTLCDPGNAPNTAMGYYAKARAYAHDFQYDPAVKLAEKALQINPKHEGASAIKADGLAALGKFDLAEAEYKRLAGNGGAYAKNGYAWFLADRLPKPSRKQLTEAKKLAEEAVASEPSANNLDTLGWANYKLGSFTDSLNALQKAKALLLHDNQTADSSWQEVHYHLGSTLAKMNRRSEAVEALTEVVKFESYLQSDPDYVAKAQQQLTKLNASK